MCVDFLEYIISHDFAETPAGRAGIITLHSHFRDGNTESRDIKKLDQSHTFDSNPGPQALESLLSPHSRPSNCFRSNLTLKAHVCPS